MTLRIQCWSGPRNISTAFMYSWAQRADTTVLDEPLYAHYLAADDRGHPMAAEVLASQPTDADEVIRTVLLAPVDTPVLFAKQMAHHLRGVDPTFLGECTNLLLTRHPREMLRSLSAELPHCDLDDTGLPEQVALLDRILAAGATPLVVDSATLLADPEDVLRRICAAVDVDFDPAMLRWPPGPKPYDGVWAPVWYERVHASTGFERPRARLRSDDLPAHLRPVLDEALPLYERLVSSGIQ